MRSVRPFLIACLCGFLLSAQQPAPQPAQQPKPDEIIFRGGVADVIVPVTVMDDKGRYVTNLKEDDFRIMDEGKPQKLKFFSHAEKQSVVIGFLMDLSNNSKIHWKRFAEQTQELIWDLLPGDPKYQGYLITYANDAEVAMDTTTDANKLTEKIGKLKPSGGAALFDAVYKACTERKLVKGEPYEPRRVIVIVGDGHDSASKKTLDEVLELAKRKMVTIFAMSTLAFGATHDEQGNLEKLATQTGGHVEYPLMNPYKDVSGYLSNPQDAGNYAVQVGTGAYESHISDSILKSVASIAGEITTQYVLVYTPELDPEGKPKLFRKIEVQVPSLPNVRILARDGYYPNDVPGAPSNK